MNGPRARSMTAFLNLKVSPQPQRCQDLRMFLPQGKIHTSPLNLLAEIVLADAGGEDASYAP